MRIALEAQELLDAHLSGVGRYVLELGRELCALEPGCNLVLPLRRLGKYPRAWRNGLSSPRWIASPFWPRTRYDIVHFPTGQASAMPGDPARIVTVHDLWEFLQVENGALPTHSRSCRRLIEAVAQADGIICVSQNTRHDFEHFCPQVRVSTTVIHHGVSPSFKRSAPAVMANARARLLPGLTDYLLYVGHHHERKNIPGMIAGYAAVPRPRPPLVLVGNSDPGRMEMVSRQAASLGITADEILQLSYVGNDDLVALISAARGLVFVPFFEGFGLPLIEAYRCGTPVVTSDNSSLRELAHPATPLVDPRDPSSIAAGIVRLLACDADESLRQTLAAYGATFTWERCARATLAFYASVINGRRST